MIDARVVVEPGSIRAGHKGPATGVVWLSIGDRAFPAPGWDDFVVVVLGWWTNAVLGLLRGTSKRVEIRFMDGPYSVELSLGDAGEAWCADLFETERLAGRQDIMRGPFLQSLVSASGSVLKACRSGGLWSADAEKLARAESLLRKEMSEGRVI